MRSMKILTKAVSVREWQKKVEPRYFRPLDESFFVIRKARRISMKQFMIPTGMRDLIPSECALRKKLQKAIEDRLDRWGYQEVVTPTIEYYKTYET